MKIYIAGKWEEHGLIKSYADRLRAQGHEITFPWFEKHLGGEPLDRCAVEDLEGVLKANLSIFIFERDLPYRGAMTELGIALADGMQEIAVVGHGGDSNVFCHHRRIKHFETFEEALVWIGSR